ncbi:hypothetical protein [Streptomyces sp. NPDC057438]|uniref:hypothetical protein n=1 Tax=Streptomyces sp. NPDC057438 TaxID=3346133 RepID=UPI00368ADFBC
MHLAGRDPYRSRKECPPDPQLGAYARAREPKRLLTVPAGHFDAYKARPAFDRVAGAAAEFFAERLR